MTDEVCDELELAAKAAQDAAGSEMLRNAVRRTALEMVQVLTHGKKVMVCGNGGSAAQAQHLAAELVGRFALERAPMAALALGTDAAVMSAVANDYNYDAVFERQVRALGRPGDMLVGMSTSGCSENVLRALAAARTMGVFCVGMTGLSERSRLHECCTIVIRAPSYQTARVQETHLAVCHVLAGLVERHLAQRAA